MNAEPERACAPNEVRARADAEAVSRGDLWRSLAEDTGCRVVLLSQRGTILAFNEAAARVLGRWNPPRVGTDYALCFPPVLRPVIEALIRAVIEGDDARRGGAVVSRYLTGGLHSVSRTRVVPLPSGEPGVMMVARTLDVPVPVAEILSQLDGRVSREGVLGELASLSDRELEVAMLIAAGMSDEDIAEELHRSVRTVHSHRRMIGRRLNVRTRAEIVRAMADRGLVARVSRGRAGGFDRAGESADGEPLPPLANFGPEAATRMPALTDN